MNNTVIKINITWQKDNSKRRLFIFLLLAENMNNTRFDKDLTEMQLKAVLTEYNDLRDEVKRRIDHRTHISYFVMTVILGTFGFYITSENPLVVVLIPSIVIYWLFIMSSSYFHHLDIVTYIRRRIEEKKLPELIGRNNDGEGWINWETYYFNEKKVYSSRFIVYILLSWAVYVMCGIIIHMNMSQSLSILYWILYGHFQIYFSYKCYKYYEKRKSDKNS